MKYWLLALVFLPSLVSAAEVAPALGTGAEAPSVGPKLLFNVNFGTAHMLHGTPMVSGVSGTGSFGLGYGASVHARVAEKLYLGLETGSYAYLDIIGGVIFVPLGLGGRYLMSSVPLLFSARYRFVEEGIARPFVGVAVGASFNRVADFNAPGPSRRETETTFMAAVRPGLEIAFGRNSPVGATIDVQLGVTGGNLVAMPSVGLTVGL